MESAQLINCNQCKTNYLVFVNRQPPRTTCNDFNKQPTFCLTVCNWHKFSADWLCNFWSWKMMENEYWQRGDDTLIICLFCRNAFAVVVADAGSRRVKCRKSGSECSDIGAGRVCDGDGSRTVSDVSSHYRRPCTQPPHSQQVMMLIVIL